MTINFPILLSFFEPGTLTGTYENKYWPMPSDVYVADYQAGDKLEDDVLSSPKKVAARKRLDEKGVGLAPDADMWITVKDQILRLRDGKVAQSLPPLKTSNVAASAKGEYVWAVEDETVRLCQWTSKTDRWETIYQGDEVGSLASHPTENKVHFLTGNSFAGKGMVREWDAELARSREFPFPFSTGSIQFSPDSKVLAFVDYQDLEVKTYHIESGQLTTLSDLEGACADGLSHREHEHYNLRWSRDGRRVFYILGTVSYYDQHMRCNQKLLVATPDGKERRVLLDSCCDEGISQTQT